MEDELVVHEDDIISSKPLGLLESSQRQEAFAMGLDLDDPEQAEAYMQAQQDLRGAPQKEGRRPGHDDQIRPRAGRGVSVQAAAELRPDLTESSLQLRS